VIWSVQKYVPTSHITFTYDSFDGEEGKSRSFLPFCEFHYYLSHNISLFILQNKRMQ